MCGFAGIVTWSASCGVSDALLEAMGRGVAHRGPDARGHWINHPGEAGPDRPGVGLVHCRLAVLDLDERSNQPFAHPDGSRIVYNGEIYNYRALREELSRLRPDYRWRTQGDTEVLMAAYAAWGEECFVRLDGMFAVAIWDASRQRLVLARDRMGQKPLYWASLGLGEDADALPAAGGAMVFASEPAGVLAAPWVERALSIEALGRYLAWGYIAAPLTIWRGVRKLPRATILGVTAKGAQQQEMPEPPAPAAAGDPVAATREAVLSAVARQMVSDVPIGCFLSGGIDSSIIALGMTRAAARAKDVRTFAIGFDDPRYDERSYAQEVADHLGTTHQSLRVTPDAAEDLPRLAEVFGEPFGDSSALPTLYLSKFAREQVTVALAGDGGDELFGGYDRYRAMLGGAALRWTPAPARWMVGRGLEMLLPAGHSKSRREKLRRFLATMHRPASERYASYLQLMTLGELLELLPAERRMLQRSARWLVDIFERAAPGAEDVRKAMRTDQSTYLPEDIFTKVDRTSMRYALEVRAPLMDPAVVALSRAMPTRLHLDRRRGKLLLRRAFGAQLPARVWGRSKMGFAVPVGAWFAGPLKQMLCGTLLARDSFIGGVLDERGVRRLVERHERGLDEGARLFSLLMLEWWGRGQSAAVAHSTSVTPPPAPLPVPRDSS